MNSIIPGFQLGKCYRNNISGIEAKVVETVQTVRYGPRLVVERADGMSSLLVGSDPVYAADWEEITETESVKHKRIYETLCIIRGARIEWNVDQILGVEEFLLNITDENYDEFMATDNFEYDTMNDPANDGPSDSMGEQPPKCSECRACVDPRGNIQIGVSTFPELMHAIKHLHEKRKQMTMPDSSSNDMSNPNLEEKSAEQPLQFEVGKYYRHPAGNGEDIAILGEIETTLYGPTFIAESNRSADLKPIGRGISGYTQNWVEISREDWMKNFSKE